MQKWFKSYGEPSGLTRWKDWRSSSPFVQKVKCKFKVSYWLSSKLFLERKTWVGLDLQMVSARLLLQCQTIEDLVSILSHCFCGSERKHLNQKLSSALQGFPILSTASSWYWRTRLQKSYSTIHFEMSHLKYLFVSASDVRRTKTWHMPRLVSAWPVCQLEELTSLPSDVTTTEKTMTVKLCWSCRPRLILEMTSDIIFQAIV
jgi:hypothetical protein